MSLMSNVIAGDPTPLKKLALALQSELVTGKGKKEADFKEAYELLEQNLTLGVSQKVVLARFNAAYGHTIHPPRFRKMLEEERSRRAESGDVAMCSACGQHLESAVDAVANQEEE